MTDALSLTIVGNGPAAPNPGGDCSSYLVREGSTRVVLDLGSGTAGELRLYTPAWQLDGIIISHLHADHYFDLLPLHYVLAFGEERPPDAPCIPLFLPPGGVDHLTRFAELVTGDRDHFRQYFQLNEYGPEAPITIGSLRCTFHPVQHYIPSHAIRVTGDDGRTLVFSADAAPCESLPRAARDADLFLSEAALLRPEEDQPDPARRGHLTAREAAEAATEAGVGQLMLTHYRADGTGSLQAHHQASAVGAFDGPVTLATVGMTVAV